MMFIFRRTVTIVMVILALLLSAFIVVNLLIILSTKSQIITEDSAPHMQVALILGTSVNSNGTPARLLKDRLRTGARLYMEKKVEKIIVSGDHGTKEYNEVAAMRDYLLQASVPAHDIFMDHAGFDTFDSVYRAKNVFGAQNVTIISQSFHLPRALYIARGLHLPAVGVSADLQTYTEDIVWRNRIREPLSRIKAFIDLLMNAHSAYDGKKIPLNGDGNQTQ